MNRLATVVAAGVLAVVPCAAAGGAQAAQDSYCWMDVETGVSACHATLAEVVTDISDGAVAVPDSASTLTSQQRTDIAASTAASYVLGIVYASAGYVTPQYMFTGSHDCDTNSDVDWYVGSMPSG